MPRQSASPIKGQAADECFDCTLNTMLSPETPSIPPKNHILQQGRSGRRFQFTCKPPEESDSETVGSDDILAHQQISLPPGPMSSAKFTSETSGSSGHPFTAQTAKAEGFLAFLEQDAALRTVLDHAALERSRRQARTGYADLAAAGVLPAATLADAIARFHGLERLSDAELAIDPQLIERFSPRFLRRACLLPVMRPNGPCLALGDPTRLDDIEAARLALGTACTLGVASIEAIGRHLDLAGQGAAQPGTDPSTTAFEAEDGVREVERLQDLASGAPIVLALNELLEAAMRLGATDIHVESGEDGARVRLRIDGRLHDHGRFAAAIARGVISRMKILSGLNIAERRLPQDGRARVSIADREVDIRVATAPVLHGENLVLRLLPREAFALDLSRLGMGSTDLERFSRCLKEPHGLIVVTGPTGSGKTTTLTAALSTLNTPQRKIVTVEDPIEYQIPGINQTQVKPQIALTFANALRAFLRHDPDVLMVGEMRDAETAAIGVQAALTGHLVLTTLHTNTAADAVIRLLDLSVQSFLLNSTLRCVVGQRLVRCLCRQCRKPIDGLPAAAAGLVESGRARDKGRRGFHAAAGCPACSQTGYKGRIGIFEVLTVDDSMQEEIRAGASSARLAELARRNGMTTMLEDGFDKAAAGLTSIEEVLETAT
jgi:general secretion pathway protein E